MAIKPLLFKVTLHILIVIISYSMFMLKLNFLMIIVIMSDICYTLSMCVRDCVKLYAMEQPCNFETMTVACSM